MCSADEAHDKMVNTTIRDYLRQYKQKIIKAEDNITKQLNQIALSTEHMFHEYVQNVSILYDLDNETVSQCIQGEVSKFNP